MLKTILNFYVHNPAIRAQNSGTFRNIFKSKAYPYREKFERNEQVGTLPLPTDDLLPCNVWLVIASALRRKKNMGVKMKAVGERDKCLSLRRGGYRSAVASFHEEGDKKKKVVSS